MKKIKLTKGIQIILATLFVLILGTIIVGVLFVNRALAADPNFPTCTICGTNENIVYMEERQEDGHWYECTECTGGVYLVEHSGATHSNGGKCTICGYQYQEHETITTYDQIEDGRHRERFTCALETCSHLSWGDTYDCSGATHDNGGACTVCEQIYDPHEWEEWGGCTTTATTHQFVYSCTNSSCNEKKYGSVNNHSGGTHSNGGICTVTGCGYTYQTHSQSTTVKDYTTTETTHTPVYACSYSGCTSTYSGTSASHTGGTHANGGKCTICDTQYQTHSQSATVKSYAKAATTHTPVYACSYSGCTSTYNGTAVNHAGATHANEGKCTTCDYQYQTHGQSTTVSSYTKDGTAHTPVYACSYTGCTSTYNGTAVNHAGATHKNEGKCTTCGYQYQTHSQSTTVKSYAKAATTHTPVYACSYSGCTATYNGTATSHSGGTHANEGKCTTCSYQYQTHSQSTTVKSYTKADATHTPIYACSVSGCTSTFTGTATNHTGGTHENGGECTSCEYTYQTHGQSTIVSSYTKNGTTHTPVHACSYTGCTATYNGTAASHSGATHENGGKCTTCNYQYQTHSQSTTIKDYQVTAKNHTPIYECTQSGCTSTYTGTSENHILEQCEDNENGTHSASCTKCGYIQTEEHDYESGECTECGAEELVQECQHTYETKNDETQHWEECTKCQEVKAGSLEVHKDHISSEGEENNSIYVNNEDGTHSYNCVICNYKITQNHNYSEGKCTKCNATEPVKECQHTYETKYDENQHWEQCSKCSEMKGENKEFHEFICIDNENGTHTFTCACGYKKTEEHEYTNGKCTDCNFEQPKQDEECEHTYEIKSDETSHWEVCSKCILIKSGSLEAHTFTNYVDNKNGTHGATCTECNYKYIEEHDYENGECSDCNAKLTEDETCTHTFVIQSDENNHWAECKDCKKIQEGTLQAHILSKYVDNNNGTHTATCTNCGYKHTEEHKTDGNCTKCESTITLPDSTNNNGNKSEDTTIADKEIPKAGIKNIIIILAVGLGIVSIITKLKMKKYKDI